MSVTEKVAYLKGLAEGLGVDEGTKEGKLLHAIVDVLSDMAGDIEDLEDYTAELTEQVDAIDEDLDLLESDYYEDYDEDCDCEPLDEEYFDVCCPNCDEEFSVDENTLLEGGVECPNCGEHLEFDIHECDCDDAACDGCHHDDDEK